LDDPFDAPDARVIVERRLLAGPPRHDDGGVAERVVAMEQAPRVALRPRAVKPLGQIDRAAVNQLLEGVLDLPRDRGRILESNGGVEAIDEMRESGGHLRRIILDQPRKHENTKTTR